MKGIRANLFNLNLNWSLLKRHYYRNLRKRNLNGNLGTRNIYRRLRLRNPCKTQGTKKSLEGLRMTNLYGCLGMRNFNGSVGTRNLYGKLWGRKRETFLVDFDREMITRAHKRGFNFLWLRYLQFFFFC